MMGMGGGGSVHGRASAATSMLSSICLPRPTAVGYLDRLAHTATSLQSLLHAASMQTIACCLWTFIPTADLPVAIKPILTAVDRYLRWTGWHYTRGGLAVAAGPMLSVHRRDPPGR
jgi:hypothetical protein